MKFDSEHPANGTPFNPPGTPVTLTNCDREPIHVPGAIQPYGALLAFDPRSTTVLAGSSNLEQFVGRSSTSLVGRPLSELIDDDSLAAVHRALEQPAGRSRTPYWLQLRLIGGAQVEAVAHGYKGVGYIEIEGSADQTRESRWLEAVRDTDAVLESLLQPRRLDDLLRLAASRIRNIINFDRVMIYRFDAQWNGAVIEESRLPHLEPYAGLHFPASDIPAQARALYRTNLVRYIADVGYEAVPIVPSAHPILGGPFDLSYAALRSVSPMHLQYLKNMGVASTLVVSLMVEGELWGLVACHHYSPTRLSFVHRHAAANIGITLGALIGAFEHQIAVTERQRRAEQQAVVLRQFNDPTLSIPVAVEAASGSLLRLAGAAGGALWIDERIIPFGQTPALGSLNQLLSVVRTQLVAQPEPVYATEDTRGTAKTQGRNETDLPTGGVLALSLGPAASRGIMWLRPEIREIVHWAGDPNKPAEFSADGTAVLSPRNSFEVWKQVVQGRSHEWSAIDREAAQALLPVENMLDVRDAVARLAESEHRFRDLLLLASDAYWESDEQHRLTLLSRDVLSTASVTASAPRAWRLGSTGQGVLGLTLWQLPGADPGDERWQAMRQLFTTRQPFRSFEFVLDRDDSNGRSETWIAVSGEPYRHEDGRFAGYRGTLVDVTARRRAENALRAKEAAEHANDAKTRFLSQVSHELRTPLNAVLGFAQLLDIGSCGDAPTTGQKRQINEIINAGQHLVHLIDELLDMSRIESGTLHLQLESTDVKTLLEESIAMVRTLAEQAGVSLHLHVDAAVPALAMDAARLRQALLNVLSNAIKYNRPQGSVKINVQLKQANQDDSAQLVRISIQDDGLGMNEAQLNKLFEPFNRLGRERSTVSGTGIGLVITRRLVEAMGGRLLVKSEANKGSEFAFEFPL